VPTTFLLLKIVVEIALLRGFSLFLNNIFILFLLKFLDKFTKLFIVFSYSYVTKAPIFFADAKQKILLEK
jgi:hypothetical protein